jgi:hypothetical protein
MMPDSPWVTWGFSHVPGGGLPSLNMDALLSGSQAAAMAGVSVAAVCNWVARGYLPVAKDAQGREIRDSRGRPRYRLRDVLKAERATSERGQARGQKMAQLVEREITDCVAA